PAPPDGGGRSPGPQERAGLLQILMDAMSGLLRQGLDGFGDEGAFGAVWCEVLVGRPADEGGLDHYTARLREGAARLSIVEAFTASEEFAGRVRRRAPRRPACPATSSSASWRTRRSGTTRSGTRSCAPSSRCRPTTSRCTAR